MDDPFDDSSHGRNSLVDDSESAIPYRGVAALEDYVVHRSRSRRTGNIRGRGSGAQAKNNSKRPDVASIEAFPPLAPGNAANNTSEAAKKASVTATRSDSPGSQRTSGSQHSVSTESRGGLYTFGFHESDRFPTTNKGGDFHISAATNRSVIVYQYDVQKQGWFPISVISERNTAAFKEEIDAITTLKQEKDAEGKIDGAADRQVLSLLGKLGQSCSGTVPAVPGGGLASQSSNISIIVSPRHGRYANYDTNQFVTLAERSAERRALIEERSRNSLAATEFVNASPKIASPSYANYLQQFASSPQRGAPAGQRKCSVSNLGRIDEQAEESPGTKQSYAGYMNNNHNPAHGRFPSIQETATGSPSRNLTDQLIRQPPALQPSPFRYPLPPQQTQFGQQGLFHSGQYRQPAFPQPNIQQQAIQQQPIMQQHPARQQMIHQQGSFRQPAHPYEPPMRPPPGFDTSMPHAGQGHLPPDHHSTTAVTPTKRQHSDNSEQYAYQHANDNIRNATASIGLLSAFGQQPQSAQARGWYPQYPSQAHEEYKAEVEKFWNSGKKHFDELQKRVSEGIAEKEPNISREREAGVRLLASTYATFHDYAHPSYTRDEEGRPKPILDSITRGSPLKPHTPQGSELPPRERPVDTGPGPIARPTWRPNLPDQPPLPQLAPGPLGVPRYALGVVVPAVPDPPPAPQHNGPPTPHLPGSTTVQKQNCPHPRITVGRWCAGCQAYIVPDPPSPSPALNSNSSGTTIAR